MELDDAASGSERVRIGDFVFDRATGEIRATPDSPGGPPRDSEPEVTRLAPQPARLLALLVDKGGELASHDEIRRTLWPDTHVDFDQSLRFCVRQIRAALDDSGRRPTYVETLPRRGYRLLVPAAPVGSAPDPAASRPAARRGRRLLWGGALVGLAFWLALPWLRPAPSLPPERPVRLAIMPFELAGGEGEPRRDLARLGERLVAELGGRSGRGIEVIGPRTTVRYSAFPFPDLARLADELSADYVLNARFLEGEPESQLVVELIRLDDGAHPWVRIYPGASAWRAIADESRDGVLEALELEPRHEGQGRPRPASVE